MSEPPLRWLIGDTSWGSQKPRWLILGTGRKARIYWKSNFWPRVFPLAIINLPQILFSSAKSADACSTMDTFHKYNIEQRLCTKWKWKC